MFVILVSGLVGACFGAAGMGVYTLYQIRNLRGYLRFRNTVLSR